MANLSILQQKEIHEMRNREVPWKKIAEIMGFTKGKCRWAYRSNQAKMRERGVSFEQYFDELMGIDSLEIDVGADDDGGERWLSEKNYIFNADSRVYLTFIPGVDKPLAIPEDMHKAMLRAYSDWDGQPATINEICRTFGIPRPWFDRYRKIHGWTHDMEPFVREELEERDVDDMVAEALQLKRRSLYQKYERQKWQQTKKDADRWRRFEYGTLNPLIAAIESNAPEYKVKKIKQKKKNKGKTAAFVSVFCDLHFGKYAWKPEVGDSYNREIAGRRVVDASQKIIDMLGRVDTVILPIGSDDEHVDNYGGRTTSGTDQDIDGTPAQIAIEYGELLISVIDMFRQVANRVVVPVVHGNHNRHTAVMRGIFVAAWYRNCGDVEVISKSMSRDYMQYGVNLIGFTHGDSEKQTNLPGLMANERPQMWASAKHRTWIVNHFHQEKLAHITGVRIFTVPALSGPDRWHFRKGYVSDPAAAVYLFNYDDGLVGTMLITPSC